MLVKVQILAVGGHLICALSVELSSFNWLFVGRLILGFSYESIDILPLPILAPVLKESWGTAVGLLTAFLRLGSVANFFVTPLAYQMGGIGAALWLSCLLGVTSFLA